MRSLRIVVATEPDDPVLLGTYEQTDESSIVYLDTAGRLGWITDDCCVVLTVEVP